MSVDRSFTVLYTKHKTQKRKTWNDGILRVYSNNKAELVDESGEVIGTKFLKPSITIACEDVLDFPSFLVEIDSEVASGFMQELEKVANAGEPENIAAPIFKPGTFQAQYTKHKTKKNKSWKDGFIVISDTGLVILRDEVDTKSILGTLKLKCGQSALVDDEIEFPCFLVNIDIQIESMSDHTPVPVEAEKKVVISRVVKRKPFKLKTHNYVKDYQPSRMKRPGTLSSEIACNWIESKGRLSEFMFFTPLEALLTHFRFEKTLETKIPKKFSELKPYQSTFATAITAEINALLCEVSCSYSSAYLQITQVPESETLARHPVCRKHGYVVSKRVKSGRNLNKRYYGCVSGCKFFQWYDVDAPTVSTGTWRPKVLNRPSQRLDYFRRRGIWFYNDCTLSTDSLIPGKNRMLLTIESGLENKGSYSMHDIWVIAKDDSFLSPCIAKSTFHAPIKETGVLELEILESCFTESEFSNMSVFAIRVGNIRSELSMLSNLKTLSFNSSMLQQLVYGVSTYNPDPLLEDSDWAAVACLLDQVQQEFHLNEDQSKVLCKVADWFESEGNTAAPLVLCQGVFGSGKSHLVVAIITFLSRVLDEFESNVRILVSALTNVAVDRILLQLKEEGFADFARVGSVKKIAKPILAHTIHYSDKVDGNDAEGQNKVALKELNEILATSSGAEAIEIRNAIAELKTVRADQRIGRLKSKRVVGATCAATSFTVLDNQVFDIVILDECSQMVEPMSLLPLGRFNTRCALIVGDPKQLPPTVKAPKSQLSTTVFSRMESNGLVPQRLFIQYRCHPDISAMCNKLFYGNRLRDGISPADRPCLYEQLPPYEFRSINGTESNHGVSYINQKEVSAIDDFVSEMLDSGIEHDSIGVIALYKAQAELLQASINPDEDEEDQVEVSTVDAFQGAEKDIIIVSCVRTTFAGFTGAPERLNVALSRAKHHLIIFGCPSALESVDSWKKIISWGTHESTSQPKALPPNHDQDVPFKKRRIVLSESDSEEIMPDRPIVPETVVSKEPDESEEIDPFDLLSTDEESDQCTF